MLLNIIMLCVSTCLCFIFLCIIANVFVMAMAKQCIPNYSYNSLSNHTVLPCQFYTSRSIPFRCIQFFIVALWVFLAFLLLHSLYYENANAELGAFFLESQLLHDKINGFIFCCILICMLLMHVLSVLDFVFSCVPNVLLLLLFCSCYGLYALLPYFSSHHVFANEMLKHHISYSYPFLVLGIAYGLFFFLHSVSAKEKIGEGDLWFVACALTILESFFTNMLEYIFEFLGFASFLAILYSFFIRRQRHVAVNMQQNEGLQNIQIPFIPFLFLSFLCVSGLHVA